MLFSYAQCFTLLLIPHCHCLDFKNHRTLSACTYLDKASVVFAIKTADLWQSQGSGMYRYLHTFLPSSFLSSFLSILPSLCRSLLKSLPFTYFWKDLRRSHLRTVTAASLKERSEQRPCEGSEWEYFQAYEGNKIKHLGNKDCLKDLGS